jgi:hypothetical protein
MTSTVGYSPGFGEGYSPKLRQPSQPFTLLGTLINSRWGFP